MLRRMQQQQQVTACNFCGTHLAPDEVLYTPDARVACAACSAKVDLVATDMRVGGNIRNGAIYSIIAAAISFVFNPFLLFTISSSVSAIYALASVNRKGDERFTQHIQRDKGMIYACSIIALVINAIVVVIVALAFAALRNRTHHEYIYQ
ncbi:MAG: hypothetical protein H6Q90_534 [Deltaproteobacteria bacterium]|nr:hypothetical protein [Deltaproteobacteria bacterium]